jgi:transcriptional regulator with XRE-family HTH domain
MHPLKAYRQARKLKMDDVVRATGLSKATISRIERGKQFPSALALNKLREFSGNLLSANDFFQHRDDQQVSA